MHILIKTKFTKSDLKQVQIRIFCVPVQLTLWQEIRMLQRSHISYPPLIEVTLSGVCFVLIYCCDMTITLIVLVDILEMAITLIT